MFVGIRILRWPRRVFRATKGLLFIIITLPWYSPSGQLAKRISNSSQDFRYTIKLKARSNDDLSLFDAHRCHNFPRFVVFSSGHSAKRDWYLKSFSIHATVITQLYLWSGRLGRAGRAGSFGWLNTIARGRGFWTLISYSEILNTSTGAVRLSKKCRDFDGTFCNRSKLGVNCDKP